MVIFFIGFPRCHGFSQISFCACFFCLLFSKRNHKKKKAIFKSKFHTLNMGHVQWGSTKLDSFSGFKATSITNMDVALKPEKLSTLLLHL